MIGSVVKRTKRVIDRLDQPMGGILAKQWQHRHPHTRFLKGQLIVLPNQRSKDIFVIKNGAVKLFDITPEGTENTIAILGSDDLFPFDRILKQTVHPGAYYQALTDCQLWHIDIATFEAELASDSQSLKRLVDYFVEKDIDYQLRIKGLEQLRADHKLAYMLAFLIKKFGVVSTGKPGVLQLNLPLTQQDFASLVGLTRETTCIQLKKLERRGVVRHKRHRYEVDRDKLHQFVSEELVPLGSLQRRTSLKK